MTDGGRSASTWHFLFAGAAAVAFAAACQPALGSFFTADDFILLQRSTAESPLAALRFLLTDWGGGRSEGGYYRPIVNLCLAWDNALYRRWAPGYRLTNIVVHGACVVLVYLLCRRPLALAVPESRAAAAFFLLHPMHDQAVLWVAGRTDLLCTVFFLGAFYCAVDGRRGATPAAALLFALSLGSKEMAATFPFMLIAFDVASPGRPFGARVRAGFRRAGPFLLVLLLYLAWRTFILGGIGGDPAFRAWSALAVKSTARLLQWLFVPWELTALKPLFRAQPLFGYVASAAWLGGIAAIGYAMRADAVVRFALAWVVLTLVPVHGRPHAWYLYLPSVGAVILASVALHRLVRLPSARAGVTTVVGAALAVNLHRNASAMATAAAIAEDAVRFYAGRTGPQFLVDAPIALRGRFLILTSEEQYGAALALFATGPRVTPLNFVYIASADDPRSQVDVGSRTVEIAVETSADTFLTLDGATAAVPSAMRAGATVGGRHATYSIAGLDAQGKINHLGIQDLPAEFTAGFPCAVTEFRQGRFAPLRGCEP